MTTLSTTIWNLTQCLYDESLSLKEALVRLSDEKRSKELSKAERVALCECLAKTIQALKIISKELEEK